MRVVKLCVHVILGSCFLIAAPSCMVVADLAGDVWKAPEAEAKKKNPVEANEKAVAAGKKIYERDCLSCHGDKGKGDGPAAEALEKQPQNLSVTITKQTDGELFWKITEGRKPMPSFSKTLAANDRWTVIHYLRTLAGQKPGAAPETPKRDAE